MVVRQTTLSDDFFSWSLLAFRYLSPQKSFIYKKSTAVNMIKPFSVDVPQQVLNDLRLRLDLTRWPDEITGSVWNYGADLSYMKELTKYWQDRFDWRKVETEINSYPNFMADIDGHQIHFMHIKGKGKRSVPLIITHGWPGSFLEMMNLYLY